MNVFTNFQQFSTNKRVIIPYAQIHKPWPGRKGFTVLDRDSQILELLRQLTPDQQQAFLDFSQWLYLGEQSENPSEPETSVVQAP